MPRRVALTYSFRDVYLVRAIQYLLVRRNTDDKVAINRTVPRACKFLLVMVSRYGALVGRKLELSGRYLHAKIGITLALVRCYLVNVMDSF